MRTSLLVVAVLLLTACATPGENDGRREDTAITDFIEVNELAAVDAIRTMDQLAARKVNDTYFIVSTRNQDYLLEYYSRCPRRLDGGVEPDRRQDSRALYPRIDTYRGCRIKEIYSLEPGQAEELRNIGELSRR